MILLQTNLPQKVTFALSRPTFELDLLINLIPMEVNILALKFMNIPLLLIGTDLKLSSWAQLNIKP